MKHGGAPLLLIVLLGLQACAPLTMPAPVGAVEVTVGGTPLEDGTADVPTTLDLVLTAGRRLDASDVSLRLDGRTVGSTVANRTASAHVAPMALGSTHHLAVAVGGYHRGVAFTVIGATGVMAAEHVEGNEVVVDVVFEHALSAAGMAALAPGGQVTWRDPRHARLAWGRGTQPAAFDVDAGLQVERGSRLAGPAHLQLTPLPAPGTLRRVTAPGRAPLKPLPLFAYTVNTGSSRASAAAHAANVAALSPTGWSLTPDGLAGTPDAAAVAAGAQAGHPAWPLVQNNWDDAATLGTALADPATRSRLATQVAGAVAAGGFPGIHLDIENLPPASRDDLSLFVEAVAGALHAGGARLAVDVVPHRLHHLPTVAAPYDIPRLAAAADALIFMAYDQHYAAGASGPVAGLDWDVELLAGSLPGAERGKVWLGLPLYARTWDGPDVTADSYGHALSVALTSGTAVVDYDFDGATPFVVWGAGGSAATYFDDTDSLARKMALAEAQGLAGVAAWRLGFEDPGFWSLFP